MQMIHLSTRTKQTLGVAILVIGIVVVTVFATKAWGMPSDESPDLKIKATPYEQYVRARPATTTTTTTTTTTAPKRHEVKAAAPKSVEPPTVTVAPSGDIWDRLAGCESGGNWSYNGSSGYDGGLQFSPATWTRLHTHWGANTGYEFAWQAPREVQIQVAILNMQVSSGAHSQWPVCSRKVGMPNKF